MYIQEIINIIVMEFYSGDRPCDGDYIRMDGRCGTDFGDA